MENKQKVQFYMYEMEYKGGMVTSKLSLTPFEAHWYEDYKALINTCFFEMRKALNLRPYETFCDALEDLMKRREQIFLLACDDALIGAVSCSQHEIGSLAVNKKHQGQGYGRKLMEFALCQMQRQGTCPIKLTVTKWNETAIKLYLSLGFEIVKEVIVKGVNTGDSRGDWAFAFTSTGGLALK